MGPNRFRKNSENIVRYRGFSLWMPNSPKESALQAWGVQAILGGMLRVELLGEIRVRTGDGREVTLRSRKALHLLAYLALHPGQAVPRERLLDLFWPELNEAAGRDNLSTTLGLLRRALATGEERGASPLQADRQTVSLMRETVTTDVAEFEALLQQVQRTEAPAQRRKLLEQALALYIGEPMPGLYADWAVEVQDRLASRYTDALRSLLQLLLHTEDFEAALEVATHAIHLDPYDETLYRVKMRAFAALERPAAAREAYQTLTQRLQDDLQSAPSQKTRELAERIQLHPESFLSTSVPTTAAPAAPIPADATKAPTPIPFAMPPNRSRFFGREPELQRLRELLDPQGVATRLVTLTGPGGVGKTRLAVELAQQTQTLFPGGACFLPLADTTDPTLLPSLLLQALQIGIAAEKDPIRRIVETLQGRPMLLILDNYEQLVEEGSLFVRTLMDHIETLQIVVTSRLRLELEGEREFPLSPLPTPGEEASLETLTNCASVGLFVDRARQRSADFALTESNHRVIGDLCAKLEGIPLALELAAGWTGMLLPEQMLEGMEERFDLLVSRRRDIAPRHRTLRAAMEGSYRLLSPEVQRLFREIAVFRGGFTRETLSELLATAEEPAAPSPHTLLLQLAELQAHSLLRTEERPLGPSMQIRYRLLETVREFGWRQNSAAERERLRERHARCFQQRMQRLHALAADTETHDMDALRRRLDEIESDMDNLRTALRHLLFEGPLLEGAQMALDLDWFWMVRNRQSERREWAVVAFERTRTADLPDEIRDRIGINRMHVAPHAERIAWYEERIATLRAQGARGRLAQFLILYGDNIDDPVTEIACMEESLALYTELGDLDDANLARAYLAGANTRLGQFHRSLPLLEACLTYNRAHDKEWDVAQILFAQGSIAFLQGDTAPAEERLREALVFYQRVAFQKQENHTRCRLATLYAAQGRFDATDTLVGEGLRHFEENGKLPPWFSIEMCANTLIFADRLPLARRLLESGLPASDEVPLRQEFVRLALAEDDLEEAVQQHRVWKQQLTTPAPIHLAEWQAIGAVLAWKQGAYRAAWAELAQCLPTIQRIGRWPLLLTCLPAAAALALQGGHPIEAVQMLGSWEGLYAGMELAPIRYEHTDHAALCAQLRALLPDFDACYAEGIQWTAQHTSNVLLRLIPPLIQSGETRLHLA